MLKIFITGSTDGIGFLAAKILLEKGHEVVFHARNEQRAGELRKKIPPSSMILVADLSNIEEVRSLAGEVNTLGPFDTIIHNAGVYQASNETIFKVNLLAPFILTASIEKPGKLIYIGSNMHPKGKVDIQNLSLEKGIDYSTSKLFILMFSLSIAKKFPDILVNTVDPGWVPTKMADYNAPDSLEDGTDTQVWLASNFDPKTNGKYFYHLKEADYDNRADNKLLQGELIKQLEQISGIRLLQTKM